MPIPPDSPWRGCAAAYPQPVDEAAVEYLQETTYYFNCRVGDSPLPDIVYRSSDRERDIVRHVFRWDLAPYEEIFQNGFEARRQQDTSNEVYFNLDHYVHHGGRPLDSRRPATHAFVSTTLNSGWHPSVSSDTRAYRYEIYAPGGIWVAETLGDRYRYPGQDEVCFASGIAPQYIRSAQLFNLNVQGRFTRRVRANDELILNRHFNPQSHPERSLTIQRPVCDYRDGGTTRRLIVVEYPPPRREKRQVSTDSTTTDWYANGVANSESYIDAAFRSSRTNEAYLFMKNEYVLLNYAPGTTDDRVVNGPLLICDGFPSLRGTAFGEHGIGCAFRSSQQEEAFIFSGKLCAVIIYAPHTTDDRIKKGPMTITTMFPFLKGTVFGNGIDAAFESTSELEAYIFKGDQYALINYGPNPHLIGHRPITQGFPSFRGTIFASGIDAAFASHRDNEAYIFKGDSYALIKFAPPGTAHDSIIRGVKKIVPNWPSLRSILPRKNYGLDVHDHNETGGRDVHDHNETGGRDHDEL